MPEALLVATFISHRQHGAFDIGIHFTGKGTTVAQTGMSEITS